MYVFYINFLQKIYFLSLHLIEQSCKQMHKSQQLNVLSNLTSNFTPSLSLPFMFVFNLISKNIALMVQKDKNTKYPRTPNKLKKKTLLELLVHFYISEFYGIEISKGGTC